MFSERTDRNIVNTGFGECNQRTLIDPTGDLKFRAPGVGGDSRANIGDGKVVEHDDVGTGGERLFKFGQIFHLNFNRLAGRGAPGGGDRRSDRAAGGDVVFLDQEGVPQAQPVVVAAACRDGIFLGDAQAGQGFAGIEQPHFGVRDPVGVMARGGCRPGKRLQEIERGALAAQQGARWALNPEQHAAGTNPVAFTYSPRQRYAPVELVEHLVHPGAAGNDTVFAGNHLAAGNPGCGHQLRRQVAITDVFAQGRADIGGNGGTKWGEVEHRGWGRDGKQGRDTVAVRSATLQGLCPADNCYVFGRQDGARRGKITARMHARDKQVFVNGDDLTSGGKKQRGRRARLHLEAGWVREARRCPSPNCNERPAGASVSLLVIHNISLPPGRFSGHFIDELFLNRLDYSVHPYFATLRGLAVSAHFLVRRRGELVQYVATSERAWHAGKSAFSGRENCNDFSIGIELEGTDERPYTQQQYRRLVMLSALLLRAFPDITPARIVGHSDIAPGRKTDPGPSFDWRRYRRALTETLAAKYP